MSKYENSRKDTKVNPDYYRRDMFQNRKKMSEIRK